MTDAPERIWIDNERYEKHWHIGKPPTSDRYAHVLGEYIRADLARPMTVAEAAKVLEPDLDHLMSLIVAMPIGRHRREALAKVTEIRALSQGDPNTHPNVTPPSHNAA